MLRKSQSVGKRGRSMLNRRQMILFVLQELRQHFILIGILLLIFMSAIPFSIYNTLLGTMGSGTEVGSEETIYYVAESFKYINVWLIPLLFFSVVLLGVSGFAFFIAKKDNGYWPGEAFLFSPKAGFFIPFLSGIGFLLIIYIGSVAAGIVAGMCAGAGNQTAIGAVLAELMVHLPFMLFIYSTVIMAAVLTRKRSSCLWLVWLMIFQAGVLACVIYTYYGWNFTSFYDVGNRLESICRMFSPVVAYYSTGVSASPAENSHLLFFIIFLIAAAGITALAYNGYIKNWSGVRRYLSECLFFKILITVLKYLTIVTFSLGSVLLSRIFAPYVHLGGYVRASEENIIAMLSAFLLGGAAAFIFTEHAYQKHSGHGKSAKGRRMMASLIISGAIFGIFRFDLSGYDSYLPPDDELVSVGLDISSLNHWVYYGEKGGDYALEHMYYTEPEQLYPLFRRGIELNSEFKDYDREQFFFRRFSDNGINVTYRLKNGRNITRHYSAYSSDNQELLKDVFVNPRFKSGTFPILTVSGNEVTEVNCEIFGSELFMRLSDTERSELLSAYQADLNDVLYTEYINEFPVGVIRFYGDNKEKCLETQEEWNRKNEGRSSPGKDSFFLKYGFEEENPGYPILPSFKRTRNFLEEENFSSGNLDIKNIESIELMGQLDDGGCVIYSMKKVVITDPDQIKELLAISGYSKYAKTGGWIPDGFYNISAEIHLKGEDEVIYHYLVDPDRMPEKIMEEMTGKMK